MRLGSVSLQDSFAPADDSRWDGEGSAQGGGSLGREQRASAAAEDRLAEESYTRFSRLCRRDALIDWRDRITYDKEASDSDSFISSVITESISSTCSCCCYSSRFDLVEWSACFCEKHTRSFWSSTEANIFTTASSLPKHSYSSNNFIP